MQGGASWIIVGMIGCTLTGCTLPREVTKTPRGAIEQLLLTQALNRSLVELSLPLPQGEPLYTEVTGLQPGYFTPSVSIATPNVPTAAASASPPPSGQFTPSWDLTFIKDVVGSQLGVLGYRLSNDEHEASYLVRVVVQAFGTNQSSSFFGLPPIQSVIIPFSLPQLTVWQNLAQDGYVRYGLDVIERTTGRLYYSTPWYSHRTHHNQYTLLFFITFRSTDLSEPP